MATQTKENKITEARFEGFGGIDGFAAHSGEVSVSDLVNFRILDDGSIEKRWGYKQIASFVGSIDDYWCGRIWGKLWLYFWVNNNVGKYDFETSTVTRVGIPSGNDLSNPKFFFYQGGLYISVKCGIYKIEENGAMYKISGYVPHVGKDWRNDLVGEINEPLNILNRRARFTYTVADPPSIFYRVLYPVKTIDSVKVNGLSIPTGRYYFEPLFNSVNISDLEEGDKVEVAVTYDLEDSPSLAPLLACEHAEVFGGMSNNRVFMWSDSGESVVYSTGYISPAEAKASGEIYPTNYWKHLYFPEGYEFKVGNGTNTIRAITRHYDRLLFFTETDVWMADNEASALEYIPTMNVNSSIGCSVEGGVALAGNDPVSIGNKKIYRWTSDTDELNECNAYCISQPISHLLDDDFFSTAKTYVCRDRSEVWFYRPADPKGEIWIYQWEKRVWYKFIGINADYIFDAEGKTCFIKDKLLFAFDENEFSDYDGTESRDIVAWVESGYLDFGSDRTKRLGGISMRGDELASTEIILSPEGISEKTVTVGSEYGHKTFSKRISSGRFKQMKLRIESGHGERTRIHSFSLSVK